MPAETDTKKSNPQSTAASLAIPSIRCSSRSRSLSWSLRLLATCSLEHRQRCRTTGSFYLLGAALVNGRTGGDCRNDGLSRGEPHT